ncbi:hypothetical protein A0J61_10445, partial [Choanephora cucurbitarum]
MLQDPKDLIFPEILLEIEGLNKIEERLIAVRHVFQSIYSINVSVLPSSVKDTYIIATRLARKISDSHDYLQGNIRPNVVWESARNIKDMSLYKKLNITLNERWLPAATDNVQLNEVEHDASNSNSKDENLFDDLPVGCEESLFCSDNFLRLAPGEGYSASSIMRDEYVDFLAFPKIHAGHALEPMVNQKPMAYSAFTKSIIRLADRWGVVRDYLFFMDRKKLLLSLVNNTNIMMRKSSHSRLTAGGALNDVLVNNLIKTDRAFEVFKNIRQLGNPTLFITLSAAETKWEKLIVILKKVVDKEEITEDDAENLERREKYRLIQSNPVTCAQYFEYRFRELKQTWKPPHGPFGHHSVLDYYYRIEFQQRDSPHVHMLVWLEDAPTYSFCSDFGAENEQTVCDFIEQVISCKALSETENSTLSNLVKSRQHHKHTHTCWKNRRDGQKICRFNIPFFPMKSTCIITPLAELNATATDEKKKERLFLKQKVGDIKRYLTELADPSESNLTFEQFIETFELSEEQYTLAVRSSLKTKMQQSNMDIQFVFDPYVCCVYIVDYINKSDKGMSRVLQRVLREGIKDNAPTKNLLETIAAKYYNVCEILAQEAAYNLLLLRMTESSRAVIFVSTSPVESRARMMKSKEALQNLPESSTMSSAMECKLYSHHLIMLYLPWRDQLNEIDKQDCQSLFRQNKQAIEEAANEFSKLPDDTISRFMEMASNFNFEQDAQRNQDSEEVQAHVEENEVSELNDFSMYILPEDNEIRVSQEFTDGERS